MWAAARIRKPETPAWCQAGSDHPSAKLFPINQGQRGLELYDPKTKQTTTIDTCFTWGHVNFDDNDVLWSSFGPAGVEGWFDTKIWDKTHDEKQAQGWSAFVLDYNGNGKRDAYTEPNQPADPTKDKRLNVQFYGDSPAPDGSIWGSVQGMPGALVRFVPGAHPPETALAEYYEVPWNNPKAPVQGFAPRGMDVDSKGVVWTVLSSGHLASFDRSKCKGPLNGPTAATGQHCPEGWTLYPLPGPNYKGAVENGSADSAYYDFVDRFDMLGVGKDVPIATGNLSEGLLALVDGKFLTLRVPYPMGFFAKGMDGRIDNPNGGWKGKGIFTTYRDASAVPRGRRQREHEQAREVPDAAGSAVEVVTPQRRQRRTRGGPPLLLLRDRPQVVHDVPDVLVLQLVLQRNHVEVRRDAVLDGVEDLTVGRSVVPFVVGEVRRGRNQIVARSAFAVDAVARRAVLRKICLPAATDSGVAATGFLSFAASGFPCAR